MSQTSERPVIVIVGPTASGKSAAALEVAREHGGEIICSDSRTVYRGMDIGTAKPSAADQAAVPHWGIDLVEPGERFTAADFKEYATQAIADIHSRGKLPIVVGGTGLYVDGLIFDYQYGLDRSELRKKLETMSDDELQIYCRNNSIKLPKDVKNRRHAFQSIEQDKTVQQRESRPKDNTIVVGIATNKDVLRRRIAVRADQLLSSGMVEEALKLGQAHGWESAAMTGNIYRLAQRLQAGELRPDELRQAFITADWQLAKRQMTWLRRNPFIEWMCVDEVPAYLNTKLA